VCAQTPKQQEALDYILKYAKDLCDEVKAHGKTETWDVSTDAKAKLAGVVKKVAELGGEAAVKYQSHEYEGLLQTEVGKHLSEQSNCRLTVFKQLKDTLLPIQAPPTAPKSSPTGTSPNDPVEALRKGLLSGAGIVRPVYLGMKFNEWEKALRPPERELYEEDARGNIRSLIFSLPASFYSFRFEHNSLESARVRLVFFSSVKLNKEGIAVHPANVEERNDQERDLDRGRDACKEHQEIELNAAAAFGKPFQEKIAYKEDKSFDNLYSDFSIVKIGIFLSHDKWVVVSRRVDQRIAASFLRGGHGAFGGRPFQPTEANLFRPTSGSLQLCELNVQFGRTQQSGISAFTEATSELGQYQLTPVQ
jgi:hypothetical protein